jgi:hypothetical protein
MQAIELLDDGVLLLSSSNGIQQDEMFSDDMEEDFACLTLLEKCDSNAMAATQPVSPASGLPSGYFLPFALQAMP